MFDSILTAICGCDIYFSDMTLHGIFKLSKKTKAVQKLINGKV